MTLKLNKINYDYKIFNLIVIVFVIFYGFFIQKPIITVSVMAMMLLAIMIRLIIDTKISKFAFRSISFVALILFFGLLKFDNGASNLFYYFSELILLSYAIYSAKNKRICLVAMKHLIYSFLILIFIFIFKYFGQPEPLSHIIEGSSQNGVPSYLIVLLCAYLFFSLKVNNTLPILPTILVFIVSFFGEGRGSIVVSLALVFLCFIYMVFSNFNKNIFKVFITLLLMFFVFFTFVFYFDIIFEFIVNRTKLSVGFDDFHRVNIFNSYVDSLGGVSSILGRGYDGTIIADVYNNNPHISYVRFHSFFGLLPLIVVFFSPLLVFLEGINVKSVFLFFILVLMLARAGSEPILFPTSLDYFFYICIFLLILDFKNSHGEVVNERF
jgi:hypothetical protein